MTGLFVITDFYITLPNLFTYKFRWFHIKPWHCLTKPSHHWSSVGILWIGPLGTNLSEILIEIYIFSFKKMHLKMSSGKWQPFCLSLNVLIHCGTQSMTSSNGNISTLLSICAWNSPVPGEFPAQRPVTRSFDVFFDLRLNKELSKQSWGWWFETPSCPLWCHCNVAGSIRCQEIAGTRGRFTNS